MLVMVFYSVIMTENVEGAPAPPSEGEEKSSGKPEGDDAQSKAETKVTRTASIDSDESETSVKKEVEEVVVEESTTGLRVGEWPHMRRIIAEDPEWTLATVPLLNELVVKHIAENFESES